MGVSVAIYRCTDHYTPGGSLQKLFRPGGSLQKLFSAPGKSGQGFTVSNQVGFRSNQSPNRK